MNLIGNQSNIIKQNIFFNCLIKLKQVQNKKVTFHKFRCVKCVNTTISHFAIMKLVKLELINKDS